MSAKILERRHRRADWNSNVYQGSWIQKGQKTSRGVCVLCVAKVGCDRLWNARGTRSYVKLYNRRKRIRRGDLNVCTRGHFQVIWVNFRSFSASFFFLLFSPLLRPFFPSCASLLRRKWSFLSRGYPRGGWLFEIPFLFRYMYIYLLFSPRSFPFLLSFRTR